MTKGPKVSLSVVCDGCEFKHEHLRGFQYYNVSCMAAPISQSCVLYPASKIPPESIPTPDWCPYRAEAVKAVKG